MRRSHKRSFLFILGIIALLVSAIYTIGDRGYGAGTPPSATLNSPANGASYQAGSSGKASITFTVTISDPDTGNGLYSQVLYKKTADSSGKAVSDKWHNFGVKATRDPSVSNTSTVLNTSPNGIQPTFVNEYGWTCKMGWSPYPPPANCNTTWSNGRRTGIPAFSGYATYSPTVPLSPGTYKWTAHGYDRTQYSSSWAAERTFKITSPPSTPTTTPPSTPTTTPTTPTTTKKKPPTTSTKKGTSGSSSSSGASSSSGNLGSNEDIVAIVEDKTPPTAPKDLVASFNLEESVIVLAWSASTDDNAVSGYEVERLEKGSTDWEKIDTTEFEGYSDFNFEPEKTYQYRVRAYDQLDNYSKYSNTIEVTAGKFVPNVTVQDGGEVSDEEGKVKAAFVPSAVNEDLFIWIEKTPERNFTLPETLQLVGEVYDIKAKNEKGEEVTQFNFQTSFSFFFTGSDARGANKQTVRVATLDGEEVKYLRTQLDAKNGEARTLTDHLSVYMLVAERAGAFVTFLRILLWIFLIIGIGFGGYMGWIYWEKKKYQKEHREDYIYRH